MILAGLAGLIVGVSLGYNVGHWTGTNTGAKQEQAKNVENALVVEQKKAVIRLNRPDAGAVVVRLRNQSF